MGRPWFAAPGVLHWSHVGGEARVATLEVLHWTPLAAISGSRQGGEMPLMVVVRRRWRDYNFDRWGSKEDESGEKIRDRCVWAPCDACRTHDMVYAPSKLFYSTHIL